jgi:hypothetical protein
MQNLDLNKHKHYIYSNMTGGGKEWWVTMPTCIVSVYEGGTRQLTKSCWKLGEDGEKRATEGVSLINVQYVQVQNTTG